MEKTGIASAIPVFLLDHKCHRCTNRQVRSMGLPVFNTWDTEQDQRRQESSFAPDMRRPRSLLHILSVMPWLSHGCSGAAAPKCAPETLPCRAAASMTCRKAACMAGWAYWPRMPKSCDISFGPIIAPSMPSTAMMASMLDTPSWDSIWQSRTVSRLAALHIGGASCFRKSVCGPGEGNTAVPMGAYLA